MDNPLVTVICLCYNHGPFVRAAVTSVLQQTYDNLQIIVIDDASTDESVRELEQVILHDPQIEFIRLEKNVGNCKAFNLALARARGEFVIDFATDDMMMPERIAEQVALFKSLDPGYGVIFTDAAYVDEHGNFLYNHVEELRRKKMISDVPQGDIYSVVVSRYFISTPTMMIRTTVLTSLNGYDEQLAYEDFDFWVRSARNFKYAFLDRRLTKVRRWSKSMSTGWYKPGDAQLRSTYLVCKKIRQLNRTDEERNSLVRRVRYELRQSVFSKNHREADLFYDLLTEIAHVPLVDRVLYAAKDLPLPFVAIRKLLGRI